MLSRVPFGARQTICDYNKNATTSTACILHGALTGGNLADFWTPTIDVLVMITRCEPTLILSVPLGYVSRAVLGLAGNGEMASCSLGLDAHAHPRDSQICKS